METNSRMQCQGLATGSQGWFTDHSCPVRTASYAKCIVPLITETSLAYHPRRHIWEAMRYVWPESHWPGEENLAGIESRL
jgi:hypothetical protein